MDKNYTEYNNLKFRIKEIVDNLPYRKRRFVKKQLPDILNLSQRTVDRILNAEIGSNQTFSAEGLIKIAALLGTKPEDLVNQEEALITCNVLAEKIGLSV